MCICRLMICLIFCCVFLAGCGTSRSSDEQAENMRSQASACIEREASIVAPMTVNLETAAAMVIARCTQYTEATRRDLQIRFPGYRDYMAPKLREIDEIYEDRAATAVAIARTPR